MMPSSSYLSIAVPLHNEAGTLMSLYHEIKDVLDGMGVSYEIIFVNDASADRTPDILHQIMVEDQQVRIIDHKENYGEAAALSTAFKFANGEIVVTMDGDGQNAPSDIPLLVAKIKEGYRAATGWRKKRQERYLTRVLPSIVANRVISFFTGVDVHDNGCGLKAYRADLVRNVVIPHGFHRFLPAVLGIKSKHVAEVRVKDRTRTYGRSHYGLFRIKEVIRELLTFPFVIDNPNSWFSRFRIIYYISFGITLSMAGMLLWLREGFFLAVAALFLGSTVISRIVFKNLERVIAIREHKAFKREEW